MERKIPKVEQIHGPSVYETIMERFKKGWRGAEIANELGVTPSDVFNAYYRHRAGLAQRKRLIKCDICAELKALNRFTTRTIDGFSYVCRACAKGSIRVGRRTTLPQPIYQRMYDAQGGHCMICRNRAILKIDHCYRTDKVRDLLCNSCNVGLGMFYDNPATLREAANYLDKHAKSSA